MTAAQPSGVARRRIFSHRQNALFPAQSQCQRGDLDYNPRGASDRFGVGTARTARPATLDYRRLTGTGVLEGEPRRGCFITRRAWPPVFRRPATRCCTAPTSRARTSRCSGSCSASYSSVRSCWASSCCYGTPTEVLRQAGGDGRLPVPTTRGHPHRTAVPRDVARLSSTHIVAGLDQHR